MGLVKKKGSRFWWIDITVPVDLVPIHGTRLRESTGVEREPADKSKARENRLLAQQYHDKKKSELWRHDRLDEAPPVTLRNAIERWKKHAAEKKLKTADETVRKLDWWAEQLGADAPVASLKRQAIMSKVEGKQTLYERREAKPATAATINRYLAAIRTLLRLCAGPWELIDSAPTLTLRRESRGRVRALTAAQAKTLLETVPKHWSAPLLFSWATGLRSANVWQLRWADVDLGKKRLLVGSEDFKNGEDFGIPLNETALGVLRGCAGHHPEFVFTWKAPREGGLVERVPIKSPQSRTWKKALKRAGIEDYRWHDNRHTWATWLVESGVDLDELQKLGGWKDREMVQRYAHFRTDHLRGAATSIDKGLGGLLPPDPLVTP